MVEFKGKKVPIVKIAAILIVAGLVITVAVQFYGFNNNSFDLSNRETRLIVSGSMDGDSHEGIVKTDIQTIPIHSMVMIKKLSQNEVKDLRVGDVISFNYVVGGKPSIVTHRIVAIDEANQRFTTCGDHNSASSTEDVKFTDVTGKVIGVSTFFGSISNFAREMVSGNNVFLTLAAVALIAIMIWAMKDIIKAVKEDDKEKGSDKGPENGSDDVPEERKEP